MSLKRTLDGRRDEATRATGPGLATSDGIAAASADRTIVAALKKGATCRQDVLKRRAVDADLEYAAVPASFQ